LRGSTSISKGEAEPSDVGDIALNSTQRNLFEEIKIIVADGEKIGLKKGGTQTA
jgi:hypothetical protein